MGGESSRKLGAGGGTHLRRGMPSRVAHRPPGPILPGCTGRKPSGIPAATVSWLWSVPAFLPGSASVDASVLRSGAQSATASLVSATCEEK